MCENLSTLWQAVIEISRQRKAGVRKKQLLEASAGRICYAESSWCRSVSDSESLPRPFEQTLPNRCSAPTWIYQTVPDAATDEQLNLDVF